MKLIANVALVASTSILISSFTTEEVSKADLVPPSDDDHFQEFFKSRMSRALVRDHVFKECLLNQNELDNTEVNSNYVICEYYSTHNSSTDSVVTTDIRAITVILIP